MPTRYRDRRMSKIHDPWCGYWPKSKGGGGGNVVYSEVAIAESCFQSIDIFVSGSDVWVYFPMWLDTEPLGMVSFSHDSQGRVWIENEGLVAYKDVVWRWSTIDIDYDLVQFGNQGMLTNAEVIDTENFCVVGTNGTYIDNSTYLWLWKDKIKNTIKVYDDPIPPSGDIIYKDPYFDFNGWRHTFNEDGTIVISLTGWIWDETDCRTQVKVAVSHDFGATWNYITVIDLDGQQNIFNELDELEDVILRKKLLASGIVKDSEGTLWLFSWGKDYVTETKEIFVYLYKSVNNGDSWSYVNKLSFAYGTTGLTHLLNNPVASGTDLYFVMHEKDYVNDWYDSKIYKSTDGGVNFSSIVTHTNTVIDALFVADGVMCIYTTEDVSFEGDYYIKRSTNDGSSFDTVYTFSDSWYTQLTKPHKMISKDGVWVLTGYEFCKVIGSPVGIQYLFYALSLDDGLTWEDKLSTVRYGATGSYAPFYEISPA